MQNIDSDLIRGNIDTIILKTMLNEDKYGLDIIKEVSDKSSGTYELKQPTLYSCLKRLENQELISSYWVDSEIGGKRHYYKLTEKGRDFYNKKQEEWARSKFIIDNLLSNYNYEEYRLVKKDEFGEILNQQANAPLHNFTQAEQKNTENDIEPDRIEPSSQEQEADKDDNSENNLPNQPEHYGSVDAEMGATEDEYSSELEKFSGDEFISKQNSSLNDDVSSETKETSSNDDVSFETEETSSNDDVSFETEETSSNDDVFEFSENQTNEDFEDENLSYQNDTDDDYPVYFEAKAQENKEDDYVSYETTDQSSNELNILSHLRDQENETINDYYGDQKSYVNHLRNLDETQLEQQDILDSSLFVDPDKVNKSINDFSDAIDKLNNFDSTLANAENEGFEEENQDVFEDIKTTNFDDEENDFENQDDLDELESIKNISSNKFFNSSDDTSYDKVQPQKQFSSNDDFEFEYSQAAQQTENDERFENNQISSENDYSQFDNESQNLFENQNSFAIDTPDYDDSSPENDETDDNMNQIDSIISKNISSTYTAPTPTYYNNTTTNYREKLSNLSKYSRMSLDEESSEQDNAEAIKKAKDIAEITKELEEEGIKIKEYYVQSNSKKLDRNYLLTNKINLIKSLILLFGYVFILSATYIILNNTPLGQNSWFSIKPFLIGFIPFGIYTIYYLVLFAISPYKKIDAKFHFRIMLFISVIITIQLLLITYCINLQLGFYSFAQKEYNHLYWIIPGIISFAPIIDNLVYLSLFKSKNFNV